MNKQPFECGRVLRACQRATLSFTCRVLLILIVTVALVSCPLAGRCNVGDSVTSDAVIGAPSSANPVPCTKPTPETQSYGAYAYCNSYNQWISLYSQNGGTYHVTCIFDATISGSSGDYWSFGTSHVSSTSGYTVAAGHTHQYVPSSDLDNYAWCYYRLGGVYTPNHTFGITSSFSCTEIPAPSGVICTRTSPFTLVLQ